MSLRLKAPLHDLPNRGEVWAWGMYDLANQSFQLLINTLLFSLYFTQVVATSETEGERAWGFIAGGTMLALAVISPIIGAMADARAWKREILLTTGVLCSVLIMSLALLGKGDVWLAVLLFAPAAIACGIGENFLGAFLPEISTPQTVGRISAIGFIMSYIGALVLLGITSLAIYTLNWGHPLEWRWLFVFAGFWFLAGITPAMFLLREKALPQPTHARGAAVGAAFSRLVQTVREAQRYRQLLRLLTAVFVFDMGYWAVIFFASVIAKNKGAGIGLTMFLALSMTIAAGVAATFAGRYQDRIGHRTTVLISLGLWATSTMMLALTDIETDPKLFWLMAAGWGLGMGSLGTSVRAMVGAFTPQEKQAEFFGLYGTTMRLAAVIGVPLFSQVSTRLGQAPALLMMTGFFVAGGLLLLRVNEEEGVAAAGNGGRSEATLSG